LGGGVERTGQRLEERFHFVVIIASVEDLGMEIQPGLDCQTFKEVKE
jgi:hypothetical protein